MRTLQQTRGVDEDIKNRCGVQVQMMSSEQVYQGNKVEAVPLIHDVPEPKQSWFNSRCWRITLLVYPIFGCVACILAAISFAFEFHAYPIAVGATLAAIFAFLAFLVQWRVKPHQLDLLLVCIVVSFVCFIAGFGCMMFSLVYAGLHRHRVTIDSAWLWAVWSFMPAKWALSWGHVSVRRRQEGIRERQMYVLAFDQQQQLP